MTTDTQAVLVTGSGLNDPRVNTVLRRLHDDARHDLLLLPRLIPVLLLARLRNVPPITATKPLVAKAYLGITPEVGKLLYLTARAIGARNAVEFGTSFGISAIYQAAAMRDNGGRFVGSDIDASKVAGARRNLEEAGLSSVSEVREGDAMQTLEDLAAPVDFVFLDGWKDLYLPVLELMKPKLRKGSVVIADNILSPPMFRKTMKRYVQYMHNPANGFVSTTLPLGAGIEYSVFEGNERSAQVPSRGTEPKLAGAVALNRVLKSQLVGVSPAGPVALLVASSVLVLSAALGS